MVTACQPSMLKIVGEVFGSRQSSRTIKRLLSVSPAYSNYDENYHDVVIAGGGIMGCSSAFFLAERMPRGTICIIERDPSVSLIAISECYCFHKIFNLYFAFRGVGGGGSRGFTEPPFQIRQGLLQ